MNSRDKTNGGNSDINLLFSTVELPPLAKLAIISVDTHSVPRPIEVIVFVISQLQILSVFLRTTLLTYTDSSLTFYETFALVDKYLSVSPALDFENNRSYSFFILGLPYIYIVLGIILLFYILRIIVLGKFPVKLLQRIWSIAIYLHPLIFFYPIHTISLRAISLSFSRHNSDSFGSHNALVLVKVTSCLALVANLAWSVGVLICLSPPFKTRSVLATKTMMFGIADMSIKAIFPVLWLTKPDSDSEALGILLLILNLIFSLFKDGMFFRLLPYYNMSILRLAAKSYAFLTLYALSAILSKAFSYTDQGLLLTVTVSILLTPVMIKLYAIYLERIFRRIAYKASGRTSPYYLSQYWHIYKDFTHRVGTLEIAAKKFGQKYFFYTILEKQIAQKNFDINTKEEDVKWGKQILEDKGDIFVLNNCVLSILITFLETSTKKNPHLALPKASLAICYIKYQHSYLRANQVIQEAFKNFPSYSKKVCYSLLWLKMMRNLNKVKATKVKAQNNTANLNSQFNIKNYLSLYQSFEKLKNDIKAQLTPQLNFWKSFQLHPPNFGALIRLARTVNDKAAVLDVYVRNYLKFMEINFLEPVLILGLYLSCVNNDVSQGEKLLRDYDRKNPRVRSKTSTHNFHEQIGLNNLLYFVVSASPHNSGQILSYSQSAAKMLVSKTDSLVGKSINIFAPSFLEGKGTHFLGFPINENEADPLDKPIQVQLIDKKGYLIHCWMYFSLEVLPKTGLSYCLLFNPATDSDSVVILKQNGTIAYYNEDFGEDMNIDGTQSKEELNIFSYCKELKIILRAFWHTRLHKENHVKGEVGRYMAESLDKAGMLFPQEQGNKLPIQQSDLERLFEKYSKGDYLIFHPSSHSMGEEDITLSFTDDHEHSHKTKIVYHASLRQVDMVLEMRLKKVSNAEAAVISFQYDNALLNKSSKLSVVVQSVFPTTLSQVRTNSLDHSGQHSVQAQLANRRSSLFQREDQAQKGNSLLIKADSEEFEDHKIAEREHKIDSNDNNEDKTYFKADTEVRLLTGSFSPTEVKRLTVSFSPSHGGKVDKKSVKPQMTRQKTLNMYQKASQILQFEAPKAKHIENNRAPIEYGSISSRSGSARSEKVLKHILGARVPSKTRLSYLVYYIITMAAFLVFLLWFSFNASAVSHQVHNVSGVLQNVYMRRFWTNLANQESRLWAGVRGGLINIPGMLDAYTETYTTNITFHNMDAFNNAIRQSVGDVNTQLQDMMMLKNVRIYTRDANDNKKLILTENTFQATTEIVNQGFINVYTTLPADPIEDYIQEASRFIFDNSNDDLLIASEALIAALADNVDNEFQTSENINTGVFAGGVAASISFVIASLVLIFVTMKEITRFMNILFTLPKEEAQHTEVLLLAFQDMLDKDYEGFDCIEALDSVKLSLELQHQNQQKAPAKETGVKGTSQATSDAATASMIRNNIFLFIKLLLPQVCLSLLSIYYYYWSMNIVREMQSQQVTINSALDNINTQSRISVQLQSMIMDNATTTIRNAPIILSLTADIQTLEQIQTLLDKFKDQNGNVPEKIQEILANIDCNEVFSSQYLFGAEGTVPECITLAAGTNRIGLVNVITDEAYKLTTFLQKFESSIRDTDTLGDLYREAIDTFIAYFDVATALFLRAYDITLADFDNLVDNLESQGPSLATVAVLVTVLVGLWNWFYGIKLLVDQEFDPKRVLSLVPTKTISANRHLKSYITMTAKLTEGQYALR